MKRKLLVIAVPAALLLGGATVIAATPAPPAPTKAAEPAEAPEAPEAPEAAGAADTGHADNPSDGNADHQFNGEE